MLKERGWHATCCVRRMGAFNITLFSALVSSSSCQMSAIKIPLSISTSATASLVSLLPLWNQLTTIFTWRTHMACFQGHLFGSHTNSHPYHIVACRISKGFSSDRVRMVYTSYRHCVVCKILLLLCDLTWISPSPPSTQSNIDGKVQVQ